VTNAVYVTLSGVNIIWDRFRNLAGTTYSTEPKILGWGTGGIAGGPFAAEPSDVGMFSEAAETRVTGTSSLTTTTETNDTYTVTGTIVSSSGQTITEMGLFDNSTKPFATTVASGGSVIGSSSGTSMNVAASYTPNNSSYVQVRTEVMEVTAGHGTTSLTVTRGQNGSTAISTIASGDEVTAGDAPGSTVVGERCFLHASFSGIPLNSGDSIAFTVNAQMTTGSL
jgi:hypothetical protein